MYYQQSLRVNYKILFVQPPYQLWETLLRPSYHYEKLCLIHSSVPVLVQNQHWGFDLYPLFFIILWHLSLVLNYNNMQHFIRSLLNLITNLHF